MLQDIVPSKQTLVAVAVLVSLLMALVLPVSLAAAPAAAPPAAPLAAPLANDLRISQVYGGGGNSGATYTNDFIEIFNAGAAPINVSGYSVQYASSSGSSWVNLTPLSGTINPGNISWSQVRLEQVAVVLHAATHYL
ncbi:MAG: lamin tail domain-containing protein [Caldilineales bacterium]